VRSLISRKSKRGSRESSRTRYANNHVMSHRVSPLRDIAPRNESGTLSKFVLKSCRESPKGLSACITEKRGGSALGADVTWTTTLYALCSVKYGGPYRANTRHFIPPAHNKFVRGCDQNVRGFYFPLPPSTSRWQEIKIPHVDSAAIILSEERYKECRLITPSNF